MFTSGKGLTEAGLYKADMLTAVAEQQMLEQIDKRPQPAMRYQLIRGTHGPTSRFTCSANSGYFASSKGPE